MVSSVGGRRAAHRNGKAASVSEPVQNQGSSTALRFSAIQQNIDMTSCSKKRTRLWEDDEWRVLLGAALDPKYGATTRTRRRLGRRHHGVELANCAMIARGRSFPYKTHWNSAVKYHDVGRSNCPIVMSHLMHVSKVGSSTASTSSVSESFHIKRSS